ncbi:helix-turn-helix domain-containing protein [Niallia taxi]|uniref:helix-turn-helix domain-containing protein n=1 Tax=Niallia taxi TaxID=2499688 RepID=UPI003F60EDC5
MKEAKRRHEPYVKLKAFLVENAIKQREIADLLGKSTSAFNQNLNGTGGDFSLDEVRLLCKWLNITADEYFLYPEVSKMKLLCEGGYQIAKTTSFVNHSSP